ncbi:type IA DNA topoisomerase [uncultured Helicobacter sp.]|uniref:type IA DNA topoisomerase n=1 Tax=uncultured Helicobacter sp. TaxID=175537 RepID=UPI00260F4F42|nr:type IA DNA topoisomerase [uncultured Helicobacter sp.]
MNLSNALIIIESPNKVEKIQKITGAKVIATAGHFKGLTQDFLKDFDSYEPIFDFTDDRKKKNIFNAIKESEGKEVYIATDPDREGYAIGYFFYQMLKNKKPKSIKRAEFFEITESGIDKGICNAIPFSQSNMKMFESWKARAVGDKLVGFILSSKYSGVFKEKISVGRVQTPVLALIVQRQREIEAYEKLPLKEKVDYKIKAISSKNGKEFYLINNNLYNDKQEALSIINDLPNIAKCYEIESKETKSSPKAPLRTSQLQEFASKTLGISTSRVMECAQALFEKGLITYHRTDSNALSKEFLDELQSYLSNEEWYQRREYKAGEQSQAEAHEAIRITHYHSQSQIESLIQESNIKQELQGDCKSLYTLIYQNTILSQAKDCINSITDYTFTIKAMLFHIKSTKCLYKGFKGVFAEEISEEEEDKEIQEVEFSEGEEIAIAKLDTQEVKKKAPSSYKESNFISLLEKNGIGRPSTYATYLPTLIERSYIILEKKGKESIIIPTQKGISLIETLNNKEEWITKAQFTKEMENVLDCIAKGELQYTDFIRPLHQKMEFAPINEKDTKPSEKQIAYAEKLAKEQGIEIPKEIYEDSKECSALIEKLKKTKAPKPPSEKQIKLAEDLANKNNLELPKGYKDDYQVCSAFIDKCFKSKK